VGICENVDCIILYSKHFALGVLNTLVHRGTPCRATYNDQLSHLHSKYLKKYTGTRGTAITEHIDLKK